MEADIAYELFGILNLDGIQSEARCVELGIDSVDEGIRFFGGERRREIFHDLGIAVHFGKSRFVAVFP